MSEGMTPATSSILAKVQLTFATLQAIPPHQRHDCLAAFQWLRKCEHDPTLSEPMRINLLLEACYHLCVAEAWDRLFKLLMTPPTSALPYTFAEELRAWDFAEAQIDLYKRLLGKLGARADAICLRGMGDGYTRINQDDRLNQDELASHCYRQSLAIFQALGDEREAAITLHHLGAHILYSYTVADPVEANRCLSDALQIFRHLEDAGGIAEVAHRLGHLNNKLGLYTEARAYFEESLHIHLTVMKGSVPLDQAWAHLEFGDFLGQQLEFSAAQRHLHRAWQIFRKHNHPHGIRWSLQKLGEVLVYRQKYASAQVILQQALRLFRAVEEGRGQEGSGLVIHALGRVALRTGNYLAAQQHFQKLLQIHVGAEENMAIAFALNGLANVAAHLHQPERSARLFGAVAAMCQRLPLVIPLSLQYDDEVSHALLRPLLDEAALSTAWQAGYDLPVAPLIATER